METLEDVIVFLMDKNLEYGFSSHRLTLIINLASAFYLDWDDVNQAALRKGRLSNGE